MFENAVHVSALTKALHCFGCHGVATRMAIASLVLWARPMNQPLCAWHCADWIDFSTLLRNPTLRILYVEDNQELRETIAMLMEGDGRSITACETGEAALQLDALQPFDVLVTDVSLPGMSGAELARTVLAKDPGRWVVLCSGYEFGSATAALGTHVRALDKQFELEDLEALLNEIDTALKTSNAA